MKSDYKRLGNYIEAVNRRNVDCKVTDLRGLSLTKEFRSSTSNIVGTDMSTYKIMHKYDFAANFMGLGVLVDKAAIVLKLDDKPNIVSGAYPVFKVKDENELHPEYLMMWLIRPEFDRFCVFKSDRGIRGGFDWNDLLEVQLPIPHITKQREIVKEYNTIQNRIALNQQLIQKLEETAQAIYKQWFVEFEFPDENGKPYKSNGGEMVWNEELQKEIPLGWEVEQLGNLIESFSKTHSFKKDKLIFFNTSDILDGEFLHSNYMDIYEMPGQAKKQIKKGDILFSEIRPNNKRYAIVRIDADDYLVSTKLMVLPQFRKRCLIFHRFIIYSKRDFI